MAHDEELTVVYEDVREALALILNDGYVPLSAEQSLGILHSLDDAVSNNLGD
jgi:hypothetical protein